MRFRNNLFLRKLLAWGINLVYGLCFVAFGGLLAQLLLAISFKIPSDSMEPSLLAGDYILVDKCSKGARLFDVFAALERKEVKIHRMPDGGSSRGMMCLYSIFLIREVGTALPLM